ncbi:MAG: DUF1007 family protein [Rhodospirillales bacterium]|nr:DUF1007 family protein [Rhodospirillales bacterium]MDE0378528.1 DUF1007 family protein [Rhodospirillales bacterium]
MAAIGRMGALGVAVALSLAAGEARANPDVWVETTIAVAFDDERVSGLMVSWAFDDFYSAHAIRTYDLDRDGTFDSLESMTLRSETFDPLSGADYHVHVWSGDEKRHDVEVDNFEARIEDATLVYAFSVPLAPPLDPRNGPVTVSLFDPENFVDFNFPDSDFLLVSGAMGAGCKFRIARGEGAQSGHPRPVTLACEG